MKFLEKIDLSKVFTPAIIENLINSGVIIVAGFILLRIVMSVASVGMRKTKNRQVRMVIRKGIKYTGISVISLLVLSEMGAELSAILGAAGVLGVAFGIASRTSLSNFISGLFLVSENTFELGDVIRIDDKTGVVHSIDMLSVKLRTFDNLLIRVPNETIISTHLTNITRFPIRRMDFDIGLQFGTDLEHSFNLLRQIATDHPKVLQEPEPLLLIKNYDETGIRILFAIWFSKTDYMEVKNSVFIQIDKKFREEGIRIARPILDISTKQQE